MRRKDREITDRAEILAVLDRCDVVHVGMKGGEYPYVVPLSFGWEEKDGTVCIYVHGAKEGYRHTLLKQDARVCVTADRFIQYVETPHGISCVYESVIGTGVAEALTGEEAAAGMACLLTHCGFAGYACPQEETAHTSLWRITLNTLTGKRRQA